MLRILREQRQVAHVARYAVSTDFGASVLVACSQSIEGRPFVVENAFGYGTHRTVPVSTTSMMNLPP